MKNWQSLLQTVKKSKPILNQTGKGPSLFLPVPGTAEKASAKTFEKKLSMCLNPSDSEILAYFQLRMQQEENL